MITRCRQIKVFISSINSHQLQLFYRIILRLEAATPSGIIHPQQTQRFSDVIIQLLWGLSGILMVVLTRALGLMHGALHRS